MTWLFISQLVLNGVVIGLTYALIAVGLSLIFGVMEIVNFAHGQVYMLGATMMLTGVTVLGLGYFPAVLLATLAVAVTGLLLYATVLRHLRQGEFERGIILTIGIGMVLQNGITYLFGAQPRVVDTEFSFIYLNMGGLRMDLMRLLTIGLSALAMGGLYLLLQHSRIGKAMRAFAQNREAAFMVGIRPAVIAGTAVSLGIGLAGLAGASLAPVFTVHPAMGIPILFKAFAIVIIGGLGHIPGAVLAAVLIGVTESLVGGFGSVALQDAVAFLAMIAILMARPEGLFGKGVRV
ncbi:branched-chain amino acid ABC transporter permease [Pseudophaeobacter sp.]|uniref:branched-chain amino acid ABC transporter permease n=1 Tax=Pseudophaeobacter sp. TaxID=1971739 RepID=UPI00220AA3A2|nr:branched-chain amino acid ABC transporter permease [uncultured Pseudophaeobacter sp.]UWS80589.1 branched-chain amino acid ABC transporter permease [Phaeobacter sp. G2]